MMLGVFMQVGGGFTGSDVVDRGQNPHTQARQRLRPLPIKAVTGWTFLDWLILPSSWLPVGRQP